MERRGDHRSPREDLLKSGREGKTKLMKTGTEEKKWKKLQVSQSDWSQVGTTEDGMDRIGHKGRKVDHDSPPPF